MRVELTVNGQMCAVEVESRMSLLDCLRDLRFHRWAYPIAATLFVLHIAVGQAEPVKYVVKRTGPQSICEWSGYYAPLLPLPWCSPSGSH